MPRFQAGRPWRSGSGHAFAKPDDLGGFAAKTDIHFLTEANVWNDASNRVRRIFLDDHERACTFKNLAAGRMAAVAVTVNQVGDGPLNHLG